MNPDTTNEKNTMHDMMRNDFGDERISKDKELNETMSVKPQTPDELTRKLKEGIN